MSVAAATVEKIHNPQDPASLACGWPFRLARSSFIHIALLLGFLAYVLGEVLAFELKVVGTIGFAMDDAWIHAAVARNFIEGMGFGIEPGRTLSVSTSPTWTLCTAFFYLFFRDPVLGTLLLSTLCMIGSVALCYLTVRSLTGRGILGILATVLLIMNPIVLWGMASGMELPLALLTFLLVLYLYYSYDVTSKVRTFGVPAALAFAAVTRPELFFLIPIALLDTFAILARRKEPGALKQAVSVAVIQGCIVVALLAPYFIFNKLSGGLFFPTTYYAKTRVRGVGLGAALRSGEWDALHQSLVSDPVAQVFEIAEMLLTHNLLGLLLIVPGALFFLRRFSAGTTSRGLLMVGALFLLPWVMGMTSPARFLSNHADRYFVIFPPLAIILACVGLDFLNRRGGLRVLPILCGIIMLFAPWRTTYRAVQLLAIDVDSTERLYRDMGTWLRDNLPRDAVLAVNDIGGIAYFARRNFIDVMGLATPEIWPAIERPYGGRLDIDKLEHYLRAHKVEYVILSPKYYPRLTNKSEIFQPIRQWSERYEHGRTISPQILYRFR